MTEGWGISLLKIMHVPCSFCLCGLVGVSFSIAECMGSPIAQTSQAWELVNFLWNQNLRWIFRKVSIQKFDYNLKLPRKTGKTGMLYDVPHHQSEKSLRKHVLLSEFRFTSGNDCGQTASLVCGYLYCGGTIREFESTECGNVECAALPPWVVQGALQLLGVWLQF